MSSSRVGLLALIVWVTAACPAAAHPLQQQPGGWSDDVEPAPVATDVPVRPPVFPDWPLLVWDDFSNPARAWCPRYPQEIVPLEPYEAGELRVASERVGTDAALMYFSVHQFSDFRVDVDVRVVGSDTEVLYGLALRDGGGYETATNLYEWLIRPDGSYAISVQDGPPDSAVTLQRGGPSPCIRTGPDALNHLTVVAQGPRLDFYANGCYVTSVTNSRLAEGDIGVWAVRAETAGPLDVRFDNFRVYSLEELNAVTFGTPAQSLASKAELHERGETLGGHPYPAQSTTQFPAGTKRLYVYLPFAGMTSERTYRRTLLIDDQVVLDWGPYVWGMEVFESRQMGFGIQSIAYEMTRGGDLPLGHWEVRAFIDDVPVARTFFSVGAATPAPTPEPLQIGSVPAPPRPALPPAETSFAQAAELYGQGRYTEALPYCAQAMAMAPNSAFWMTECAKVYDAAGKPVWAQMLQQMAGNLP